MIRITDTNEFVGMLDHMFTAFFMLGEAVTRPDQYLSVSWRSAEVMGCVLNLSEVFLLSPG